MTTSPKPDDLEGALLDAGFTGETTVAFGHVLPVAALARLAQLDPSAVRKTLAPLLKDAEIERVLARLEAARAQR
jgi:hypothetical protein